MSLSTVIAVLIGFATVMALLSLIVTALVQITVALLGLRGRNLEWGLQLLLQEVLGQKPLEAKGYALKVVNASRYLAPQADQEAMSPGPFGQLVGTLWRRLVNPQVTWIEPTRLADQLNGAGLKEIAPTKKSKLEKRFTEIGGYLGKRFSYHARLWTIAWSVLVAAYFQLSSPQLLHTLATNPDLRESLVAEAETLYGQADQIMQQLPSYEDVSQEGLHTLIEEHPKLASRLREAAGVGDSRDYIMRELELVLTDVPEQRGAILEEYGNLLDELHRAAVTRSVEQIETSSLRLAKFDIRPWEKGWVFYQETGNVLGVGMTAVFLTFGAPFWFELLGRILKLRDVLSSAPPKDKKRPDSDES